MKLSAPLTRSILATLALAAPLAAGCNALSGLGDLHVVEGGGTGATTSGSGGGGTTTGAGGQSTTSAGGAGGGGGAGGATTGNCSVDANCPGAADGCATPRCKAGVCGDEPAPKGTVAKDDVAGDCQSRVCDGAGGVTSSADDADVPPKGGACADDGCNGGVPFHHPQPKGFPCAENGGSKCDGEGACVACLDGVECPSGVCKQGVCVDAGCGDGVQNGGEAGVDCGGPCPGCADGAPCSAGADCASGVCDGKVCSAPTCGDKVKNGGEGDVDCGGPCSPCASGKTCAKHADCATEACLGGTCAAFVQVAAGNGHACVVLGDGSAYCWGANGAGQLGDGTTQANASPQPVKLAGKASQLALGNLQSNDPPTVSHSCAVVDGGVVTCWGANDAGQLGRGTQSAFEVTPGEVKGPANVIDLSAGGRHTCTVDSSLWCWGDDERGQLGTGNHAAQLAPTKVSLNKITPKHVSAGSQHTCIAGLFDGTACTGADTSGQLGNGNTSDSSVYVLTSNLVPSSGLSASGTFTLAWGPFNGGSAWGDNSTGQLGTGQSPGSHSNPNSIKNLSGVVMLSAGTLVGSALGGHSCAVFSSGGASCWGDNSSGQLGLGNTNGPASQPQQVPNLKNVVEVAAGGSFTCARLKDGPLRCWGRNDLGQLGRGLASAQPGTTPEAVVWP